MTLLYQRGEEAKNYVFEKQTCLIYFKRIRENEKQEENIPKIFCLLSLFSFH